MADPNDDAGIGDGSELTTIVVDAACHQVLIDALDLYQRVAMGQWSDLPQHAPLIEFNIDPHELGRALNRLRSDHTVDPVSLRHPNASLSIRGAGEPATIACDIWHALGGGMPERRDDRLAPSHTIRVTPAVPTTHPVRSDDGF